MSSFFKTEFTDWPETFPQENLRDLDCVFMKGMTLSRGRWANTFCSMEMAYICKKTAKGYSNLFTFLNKIANNLVDFVISYQHML